METTSGVDVEQNVQYVEVEVRGVADHSSAASSCTGEWSSQDPGTPGIVVTPVPDEQHGIDDDTSSHSEMSPTATQRDQLYLLHPRPLLRTIHRAHSTTDLATSGTLYQQPARLTWSNMELDHAGTESFFNNSPQTENSISGAINPNIRMPRAQGEEEITVLMSGFSRLNVGPSELSQRHSRLSDRMDERQPAMDERQPVSQQTREEPAVHIPISMDSAKYVVLKCRHRYDLAAAKKYGFWSSTTENNMKMHELYQEHGHIGPIYIIVDLIGKKHYAGIAEMVSPVDLQTKLGIWSSPDWKGAFRINWHLKLYVPHAKFAHLKNTHGHQVPTLHDANQISPFLGVQMVKIFYQYHEFVWKNHVVAQEQQRNENPDEHNDGQIVLQRGMGPRQQQPHNLLHPDRRHSTGILGTVSNIYGHNHTVTQPNSTHGPGIPLITTNARRSIQINLTPQELSQPQQHNRLLQNRMMNRSTADFQPIYQASPVYNNSQFLGQNGSLETRIEITLGFQQNNRPSSMFLSSIRLGTGISGSQNYSGIPNNRISQSLPTYLNRQHQNHGFSGRQFNPGPPSPYYQHNN
ncbi:hypothetical protein RUND412_001132 [Rhizina undulata]